MADDNQSGHERRAAKLDDRQADLEAILPPEYDAPVQKWRKPEFTAVHRQAHEFREQDDKRQRCHDHRIGRGAMQRPQNMPGNTHACGRRIDKRSSCREGQRGRQHEEESIPADMGKQQENLPGKGEQRAVGDVRTPGHAEGKRITERERSIERGDRHGIGQLLQQVGHCRLPVYL